MTACVMQAGIEHVSWASQSEKEAYVNSEMC